MEDGETQEQRALEARNPGMLNPATPGTVTEGLSFPSIPMLGVFCLCPYRAAAEDAAGLEISD